MGDVSWLEGKWESTSVDNFDEFMKTLGVNVLLRKASAFATTYFDISRDGDSWTWKWKIAMKSGSLTFKFNEDAPQTTPDGRPVVSKFWSEGSTLKEIQTGKPHNVDITRTLMDDGQMFEVVEANGVVSKRTYKKTG